MGTKNKISRAENIATTPPNFLEIERKIAYAHKKYHSGLMWTGVTRGFAGIKFSGSPKILGANRETLIKVRRNNIKPAISLTL